MKELYSNNADFKRYVDKHCCTYNRTADQALENNLVKAVADQYTHPDDTYTFGNLGPLSRLTNADRIRAMSDEELAADRVKPIAVHRAGDLPVTMYFGDFDGFRATQEKAVAEELKWLKQEASDESIFM